VGLPDNCPYPLKIWIPASLRQIMRMTDPVPVHRSFVTNFAARHYGISL
jgi:hypothetical protein